MISGFETPPIRAQYIRRADHRFLWSARYGHAAKAEDDAILGIPDNQFGRNRMRFISGTFFPARQIRWFWGDAVKLVLSGSAG